VPARRRFPATAAVVAAVITASACSGAGSSRPHAAATTTSTTRPGVDGLLSLGQLAPITGPVSTIADSFTVPVKLAVDEMNFSGGVNGKLVGLTVADDASTLSTARAAFSTLLDTNHVDAIIGPSTSQIALDLIGPARKRRVVICSGSNSYGPISAAADSSGFYFRTAPPDRLQADALATLVAADHRRRPVVLAAADAYGTPFSAELLRALKRHGIRGVPVRVGGNPERVVTRALAARPDAIVLIGFPPTIAPLLRALAGRGKGPNSFPVYGSDGLQSADLGAQVDPTNPAVVAGMKGTTPAGSPAGIDHPFNARLFTAGVEPFFSASTYDCAILVGLAAVAAHSDDPGKIRDHFAANLTGKVDCTTFLDCARALKKRRSISYHGASSTFDRWQRFEPGSGVYDVWTLGLDARPNLSPPTAQIQVP
jgi:branched-chain amino acid transport system substrate-binding protein